MTDHIRIDARQIDTLLKSRGWSRERLLEQLGAQAEALGQAEARGTAPAPLACAIASALDVSPAQLDGGSPQAQTARQKTALWITFGIAMLFLLSLATGYRVGADMAARENYRDCVAAGGVDCGRS